MPDERRGLVAVAGVEDGGAVDRAELGEILETHLRGAVFADRDARMGAAERERRAADRGHADEVVGAAQERREGRAERPPAEHLHADGRGHHLLLRDVHLDEALRMGLGEDLGERRVRHLAVESHDVTALVPERRQGLAVRLAGRDLAPRLVRRPVTPRRLEAVGLARLGRANVHL